MILQIPQKWIDAGAEVLLASIYEDMDITVSSEDWDLATMEVRIILAAVLPLVANEIESACPHGHLIDDKKVCYRCKSAASIVRGL